MNMCVRMEGSRCTEGRWMRGNLHLWQRPGSEWGGVRPLCCCPVTWEPLTGGSVYSADGILKRNPLSTATALDPSAALLFIETASYLPNWNPCLKVYFISVHAPHCGQKYLPKCKYNYSMDIHTSSLRKSQNGGKVGTAKGEKGETWPRLWSSGCMVWARWQAKAEGSSARCCSVWRAFIPESQFLLNSHLDSSSNQDLRQTAMEELNQFLSCVHLSLISCRHHRVKCSVCSLVCDQS